MNGIGCVWAWAVVVVVGGFAAYYVLDLGSSVLILIIRAWRPRRHAEAQMDRSDGSRASSLALGSQVFQKPKLQVAAPNGDALREEPRSGH